MWRKILLAGVMGAMFIGGGIEAKAAEDDPKAEIIKSLFELGEGCKAVLDPETNEIKGILVIGSADISRSLKYAEALRRARRDAQTAAQKVLSEYLNTSVKVQTDEATGFITITEGSVSGDGEGSSLERTTSLRQNTELFKSVSQSIQSGLEKEGEKREEGMLVAIYSWEPAKCAALKRAAQTMAGTAVATSGTDAKTATGGNGADSQPNGDATEPKTERPAPGPNTPVGDKTSVAPNVSEFF